MAHNSPDNIRGADQALILVVLIGQQFAENYLLTGALKNISQSFRLKLLVSSTVHPALYSNIDLERSVYKPDPKIQKVHFKILDLQTWLHRERSTSFQYRLRRRKSIEWSFVASSSTQVRRTARLARQCARIFFRSTRDVIFHNSIVAPIYYSFLKSRLARDSTLQEAIRAIGPDLIVCPVSAFDPDAMDLLKAAEDCSARTLFLADNWDNVSSKSVYWRKPDYIGVWGLQSKVHAIEIQGFDPEHVFELGTPRFQTHFDLRNEPVFPKGSFRYVLFVGTALAFDELYALRVLENEILSNRAKYGDLKIVYRPHPWRQSFDDVDSAESSTVIIDRELSRGPGTTEFSDHMTYLTTLLLNSELVIGGLTSMMIESAIVYKRFIALVHDDRRNITSQHRVLRSYEHLRGIQSLPNLHFCDDLASLSSVLSDVWASRSSVEKEEVDRSRQYFLCGDDSPYSLRLNDAILRILDCK